MVKIECEQCHCIGLLQVLSKNYSRVRHYLGYINNKPKFHYCQNSIEWVSKELSKQHLSIDQLRSGQDKKGLNIGLNLREIDSSKQNIDRLESKEPDLSLKG
jgi:hypothetical protein